MLSSYNAHTKVMGPTKIFLWTPVGNHCTKTLSKQSSVCHEADVYCRRIFADCVHAWELVWYCKGYDKHGFEARTFTSFACAAGILCQTIGHELCTCHAVTLATSRAHTCSTEDNSCGPSRQYP